MQMGTGTNANGDRDKRKWGRTLSPKVYVPICRLFYYITARKITSTAR